MTKGTRKVTKEQAEVIHGIKDEFGNRLAEFVELLELAFNVDVNSIEIKRNREGNIIVEGNLGFDAGSVDYLVEQKKELNKIRLAAN